MKSVIRQKEWWFRGVIEKADGSEPEIIGTFALSDFDEPETIAALQVLEIGQDASFGGGASPIFRFRRIK